MRIGKHLIAAWAFPVLAVLLIPGSLFGQSTALLTGTVLDPSGAAITQALVTCRNTETGLSHSQRTDVQGLFRFPALPVGTYDVTAAHSGFTSQTQSDILLVTGHSVDVTIRLQLGSASQTVVVRVPTQEIQLTSSVLQNSIQSRSMRDLPLNGRNPLQLTYLIPGTVNTLTQNEGGVGWGGANNQISVNGNRGTDNNFELDGVTFTDPNLSSTPILPNPDALQEFTVKSANFNASQRGAGASVQFTTRSGTNRFHGEAFEFIRNNALDARNYFSTGPAIPFKRNQFGGTFGGPIVRNRAFFFASYQGTRQVGGASPAVAAPPTAAQQTGDFTGFNTIYDPLTGKPFPGNSIPSGRITPLGAKIAELFPLPNQPNGTYEATPRSNQNDDQALGRIDYNLTSRDHLFGRYFYDKFNFEGGGAYREFYNTTAFTNQSLVVSDTHTFTPNLLFVGAFSYSRFPRARTPITPTTMQALGVNVPLGQSGYPAVMSVKAGSYGSLASSGLLVVHPQTWEYRGDLTWSHGKHMIQFGLDALRNVEFSIDPNLISGSWGFDGSHTASPNVKGTGDAFADLLLGLPDIFTQNAVTPENIAENSWMMWAQDNWHISPTVVLDLGLQWVPWLPAEDRAGPQVGFVPGQQSVVAPLAPSALVFSGDPGIPQAIFRRDWNNLAPRIGLAWNVDGKGKTVVRSAYGIFFRSAPFNLQRFSAPASAFRSLNVSITDPVSTADPYAGVPGGVPFPWTPTTAAQLKEYVFPNPVVTVAFTPNSPTSYVQEWNLTVQRQALRNTGVTLAYVGNHMVHGIAVRPANVPVFGPGATEANLQERRPFQGIGYLQLVAPFEYSNYNALQLTVTAHAQNGLTLLTNFVYSKCLDNYSDSVGDDNVHNKANPNLDYARCDFDTGEVGNVSLLYDVPRITELHGIASEVVNNWHLSTILSMDSGFPFSIESGLDNSLTGVSHNDLADQIAPSTRPSSVERTAEYFNTAAYVQNKIGTFGNSGRNSLTAPGAVNWDFGLMKDIPITEAVRGQFRFEAFNFVNRPNFDAPQDTLTDHNFGQIITAESPRVVQFAFKLMF